MKPSADTKKRREKPARLAVEQLRRERAILAAEERAADADLMMVAAARRRAQEIMAQARLTVPDVLTAFALLARSDETFERIIRSLLKANRAIARDAARTEAEVRKFARFPRRGL
jgi:hypothetical protein